MAFAFLVMQPRPFPTLFPYTTLSRSFVVRLLINALALWITTMLVTGVSVVAYEPNDTLAKVLTFLLDRKSTRLNSSHVRISYAVFCLKKNNSQLSFALVMGREQGLNV